MSRSQRTLRKIAEALTIECPKCGEQAGNFCVRPNGWERDPHDERYEAVGIKRPFPPPDPSPPQREPSGRAGT